MPTQMIVQTATTAASPARSGSVAGAAIVAQSGAPAIATPAQQPVAQQAPASREEINAAASEITKYVQNVQRNLNFSVDEDSGQTVIKVIDRESDEVIRQIPSEEMLALARRLRDLEGEEASGLLVRSQA